ncbi:thioredoxin family protein [Ornithinibacillus hominis]|uniref:Thioredoxin family protein n=1 Tax=Ornithinibacillus hominis TaxID=2763055 RepID=A0A923L573_9BACI|nr:thioredoxin family protein [Ornithinibacillus hominis]MBC5636641.1 thioredoxin family protein [Ornithinibacillus hominis]
MQKKMIIIIAAIVVLFFALYFVIDYKNNKALEGNNPYGKTNLEQATIDQLNDPNYQNQIVPEALNEKVENGESVTVYYYSPICVYCKATTPYLVPLAEEMGVDMVKLNLLEFSTEGNKYGIQSTPTLVHYEDGKEVARLEGQQEKEVYAAFFEEYVLK